MSQRPRVIKGDQLFGMSPAPFNEIDTIAEIERRLVQQRQEGDKLIADAKAQVKKITEDARNEGYQAGYKDGLAKGQAEANATFQKRLQQDVDKRMQTATTALGQAVGQLLECRDQWLSRWELDALHVACQIARRIVRRMLADPTETARKTLSEALALVGRCPRVTIHVNPADADSLRLIDGNIQHITRSIGEVRVISDNSITAGGCRLESEFGAIDATIETQFRRIETELTGGEESLLPPSESPALPAPNEPLALPPPDSA